LSLQCVRARIAAGGLAGKGRHRGKQALTRVDQIQLALQFGDFRLQRGSLPRPGLGKLSAVGIQLGLYRRTLRGKFIL
jgi:hypothetical protein